jgi:twitching motility two-component system response regulator PilG
MSLLAQLKTRQVTGCLRVFTNLASWSIYLEAGQLIYATSSDQIFERLEYHLLRLNSEIPGFNYKTYQQMGLVLGDENHYQLIPNADYHAICWLVNQEYITAQQAGILIEELAKEVLETFISLKEGNYKLDADHSLCELQKFCHLDLQLIVEECQQQLRNRQNIHPQILSNSGVKNQIKNPLKPQENDHNLHPDWQLHRIQKLYTIACIDDSQAVLNSILNFLDEKSFSVVMINDPVKALMQIIRSKPDLILLDVEMPNLDGYELCSLLRRNSMFKDTPIIMVTGRKGFLDKAKAKIVRSSGYLTKPFTKEDLLKMISKHLK